MKRYQYMKGLSSALMLFVWFFSVAHCVAENFHQDVAFAENALGHHHHCEGESTSPNTPPQPDGASCDTELKSALTTYNKIPDLLPDFFVPLDLAIFNTLNTPSPDFISQVRGTPIASAFLPHHANRVSCLLSANPPPFPS